MWETEGCGSLSLEKGKRMWLVAKSDHDTARDGMVGWCKERKKRAKWRDEIQQT